MNPRFPLYIVSKGRWESRLTAKHLEAMKVPYHIVVEAQERDKYEAVTDHRFGRILTLLPEFQEEYDAFSDLGAKESKGSGPARNFAWWHSKAVYGATWHWVMDDNINGFYRLNHNLKVKVDDGTTFRCMEDFCLRYENVAMAGPNYFMFASRKSVMPPFVTNTRIYSCNLIRNSVPMRWRGRYNEDTDLSLRMLKAGFCTVLFNAFLQYKMTTLSQKGGNTEVLYANGANKLAKSKMLVHMHPDVARLAWKFGRWHHHVDYSGFKKNLLIPKPGIDLESGVDNYGMELKITRPDYKRKGAGK